MLGSWTKSEDDFQGYLISSLRRCFLPKIYPKVSKIAGDTISPEIDALGVDVTRKYIVGYEFKLLNAKKLGTNYKYIHSGIGQALSYFNYGVDFAYLILGIPNTSFRNKLLKKINLARKIHQDKR